MNMKNRKASSKNSEAKEKLLTEDAKDTKTPQASDGKPKKPESLGKVSHHRIWSRLVVVVGVVVYIWYTSKNGKETSLAKQKETLQQRGQAFKCDEEYLEEIETFPGCAPKKCGRYVSDKLVTGNEADVLLKIAKRGGNLCIHPLFILTLLYMTHLPNKKIYILWKGIALGGSDGGASILDLHSGALSYGEKFVNVYSIEESKKIFNAADLAVYKVIKSKIQHAIAETFHISSDSLYLTHPTFFSRLTNLDPKTEHDEYWHVHVDKVTYESFHYTSLLYLSDHGVDFNGGRLVWLEGPLDKPSNNVTLEPRKGRVAMFTSGAENVHYVERVTKGTRYAITVSFTCDVSKSIKDPIVPRT